MTNEEREQILEELKKATIEAFREEWKLMEEVARRQKIRWNWDTTPLPLDKEDEE